MKIAMKISSILAAIAVAVLLVPTTSRQSEAQGQERHPHYLRALSDLRLARGYLDRLTPNERIDEDQQRAINEIDKAIDEIRHASIDDGKDIRDHAPIDARIEPRDRFAKAHEALQAAMGDVRQAEDDPRTRALQGQAMDKIRRATAAVEDIQRHRHFL
jgi:hypothetical protein